MVGSDFWEISSSASCSKQSQLKVRRGHSGLLLSLGVSKDGDATASLGFWPRAYPSHYEGLLLVSNKEFCFAATWDCWCLPYCCASLKSLSPSSPYVGEIAARSPFSLLQKQGRLNRPRSLSLFLSGTTYLACTGPWVSLSQAQGFALLLSKFRWSYSACSSGQLGSSGKAAHPAAFRLLP